MKVQCEVEWELGEQLDSGGFGRVFSATGPNGEEAAVKLVPKVPGADRELLFEELDGARNVVPVIDRGETDDAWALVMPIARPSLASTLAPGEPMPVDEAVAVLIDIATALVDIGPIVVHRDLKPSNVLRYDGAWCLADFGISRYAEATTADDTRKFAWTRQYASPEQWRGEHTTSAADIYALGVIAYQLLSGGLPFSGPAFEDYRLQHLQTHPAPLHGVPAKLASLVDHCLMKAADARPTAERVLARLQQATATPRLQGAAALAEVNQAEARKAAEQSRAASEARTDADRRAELAGSAGTLLGMIGGELLEAITDAAPDARVSRQSAVEWSAELGSARLVMYKPKPVGRGDWGGHPAPAIDVVVESSLALTFPSDPWGYQGRSHSLYFCDAVTAGTYSWFEMAFMANAFSGQPSVVPFALATGNGAALALNPGLAGYQLAWPFTELVPGDLDGFLERWLTWFARAGRGGLHLPSPMPELPTQGTWRQS